MYGEVSPTNDAGAGILNNLVGQLFDEYTYTSNSGTQDLEVRRPRPRRGRLRPTATGAGRPPEVRVDGLRRARQGPRPRRRGLHRLRALEGADADHPDHGLDRRTPCWPRRASTEQGQGGQGQDRDDRQREGVLRPHRPQRRPQRRRRLPRRRHPRRGLALRLRDRRRADHRERRQRDRAVGGLRRGHRDEHRAGDDRRLRRTARTAT